MQNHQVHWYRGLFLRPQHFQAQDRFWQEQLAVSQNWLNAYGYGVYAFAFDSDTLTAGTLRVTLLKARLRDGTLLSLDTSSGDAPLEFEVKQWLKDNEVTSAMGYVAIAKMSDNRPNVSDDEPAARFSAVKHEFRDENAESPKERIDFRQLRLRLVFLKPADEATVSEDDKFALLPIGRFRLTTADSLDPTLDDQFAPAMLAINAWPGMHWQFIRDVHDRVTAQLEKIATALGSIRFGADQLSLRERRRLWLLDRLNWAKTELFVLSNTRSMHPYDLYCKLADIVGRLSIFAVNLRAVEIPPYDHDDPKPCLLDLVETIYDLMKDEISLLRMDFRSVDGETMFVELNEAWFHPDCTWYFGIHRTGVSDNQLAELESEWFWDQWLFQTREYVTKYNQKQTGLLEKERPEHFPPELPSQRQWTFYQIDQENSLAWKDIVKASELAVKPWEAMRITEDRIYFQVDGRPREFRFALFGVQIRRK